MTDQKKSHNQSPSEDPMPHKQQEWNKLIELVNDTKYIEKEYEDELRNIEHHVDDGELCVSKDFSQLSKEARERYKRKRYERNMAASSLISLFSLVPDKQKASNDLIGLKDCYDSNVRFIVAEVLGYAYSKVPNKQNIWKCLIELKNDSNVRVKVIANYSLGRASIFDAAQAENDIEYKRKLEIAISFFEKAAKISRWSSKRSNPSQFCLPFYRSYHAILFEEHEAIKEADRYLAKAKHAAKGSKSKELLSEAIECFANALKQVQNLENLDLEARKTELNLYRQYCENAEMLMRSTEKEAPVAVGAIRKGLPILGKNLKEILEEIQNKAKVVCEELEGTPEAKIACTINKEVQKWEISDPDKMAQYIEDLAFTLKNLILDIPENERLMEKIEMMRNEKDLTEKFQILLYIIGQIPKENNVLINIEGDARNIIVNPNGSNISISEDTHTLSKSSGILKLILEHPIVSGSIATVAGGIILFIVQKKYFS